MPKKQPNSAETHSKYDKYNAKNPPCKTYGFLIYPESADPNFRQIISENFDGSWALSPLHDSDMHEDGTLKKPHYHGIITFDKKQRPSALKKLLELVGANPFVIAYTNSERVKGAYDYFTHQNNPEKAQYSDTGIELFKGFDINDFKSLKELALYKKAMLKEIFSFVELNELVSFRALMSYAKAYRPEWFEFLTESHSYIVINFIKSMSWEKEKRINLDISKLKKLPTE